MPRSGNKSLALIQGTKADNFYVTMGCGAQGRGQEARLLDHRPGSGRLRRAGADPDRHAVTATKPASGADRPYRHPGADRPDAADEERRHQGDPGRHDRRPTSRSRRASISSDNSRRRQVPPTSWRSRSASKGSVVVMNEQPGSPRPRRGSGFLRRSRSTRTSSCCTTQYVGDNPAKAAADDHVAVLRQPGPRSGVFATNVLVAQGVDTGLKTAGVAGQGQDRRLRRRPDPGLRPQEAASSRR